MDLGWQARHHIFGPKLEERPFVYAAVGYRLNGAAAPSELTSTFSEEPDPQDTQILRANSLLPMNLAEMAAA